MEVLISSKKMAESVEKQIGDQLKKCTLEEEKREERDFSVEDNYMWNCLNELDDDEDDIDKISHVTHKFLMANAIKSANKTITECMMDGKVLLTDEQREKKVDWLIDICYTESLKMLKKKFSEE